jgi:F0F1-type ATP synthase alpha subunit
MTETIEQSETGAAEEGGIGRVVRVIGPVVDVEFAPDEMPAIFNALEVERTLSGETMTLTLEVAQHLGDNQIRAIAMQPTDGLVRGAPVQDTGSSISVPVGDVTKGHVFNVLGKPLDVKESSLEIKERWPIHRPSPAVRPARVQDRDVRDRHQGHRPADALRARWQDRPVRRRRCRQDRADPGDDLPGRRELRWCLLLRRCRRAHP